MKMVNTSLLAIAAGVLISPVVNAAIVDDDGAGPSDISFFSDEYLSTADAADTVDSGSLSVTLEAEYAVNDVVTWAVSGSAIEGGFPSSVIITCVDAVGAVGTKGLTFGKLNDDADGSQYRVTEVDETCDADSSGLTTDGVEVEFSAALTLNAQAVDAANTIEASFEAETNNGLPLDTDGGAARMVDLVVTGSQYSVDLDEAFDGIVDVEAERLMFEAMVTDDFLEWTINDFECPGDPTPDNCTWATPIAVEQEVGIGADFAWVNDTDENTAGIQPEAGVFTFSGGCTFVGLTATELTAECDNGTNDLTIETDDNAVGGNDQILPATSFTGTHVLNFTGIGGDGSITVASVDLGEWLLNGFQAFLSYTPYGSGISQVIYVANRGSQSGDVTVDYVAQDGSSGSLGVVGTLAATSTLSIGPAIQAALPAALQNFGRLALTVVANVPACDAQINAQYNASGNRAYTSARDNCEQDGGSY